MKLNKLNNFRPYFLNGEKLAESRIHEIDKQIDI